MDSEIKYCKTESLLDDACQIVDSAQLIAYKAVDVVLLQRNWYLGKRIAEEVLADQSREALYGRNVIKSLSTELTKAYGSGFTTGNLYSFVSFYKFFPDFFHTACKKSVLLSWSHYRTLLQVEDKAAREWYAEEAGRETWSVRVLQRNISTQYYYRMLQLQHSSPK